MTVLSLSDVKVHLNIATEVHDGELGRMIDAAETAIAERVGPLEEKSVTERVAGFSGALVVTTMPVVQLTSVTSVNGTTLDVDDLFLSPAGVITYETTDTWFGERAYDVVYTAGRDCPADLQMAALELVRHLWETQRGGARRPGSPSSETLSNTLLESARMLTTRVEQLLAPHLRSRAGGFA